MLETLQNVKGIIKNYFFDEKKYFEGLSRRFERFRNFLPKPKGGGTTGVTCTCKGGTTVKFRKIKKVLETLPNFKGIIKNYFFDEKNILKA